MTVTNENRSVTYDGDGSTTVFPVANDGVIYFLQPTDLLVTLIDADGVDHVQALTTDYTVSGAGDADGGSVTMLTPPAAGERLRIERWVDILQPTNYPENTKFPAASHERALDRLTMIDQQQQGEIDRAPKFSETSGVTGIELPVPEDGRGIKYDAETGKYVNTAFDPDDAQEIASTARDEAVTARNFAARWASDPEDGPTINDGVNPPGQSAYHWSQKSAIFADIASQYADEARNNWIVKRFEGDGINTDFDLEISPGTSRNCFVAISGVLQSENTYTLNGTVLTFHTPPPASPIPGGANIEIRFGNSITYELNEPSDGSVTTPKLADGAVTEPKLADDSVTAPKLAVDAVTTAKIANSAVTRAKINDAAVNADKITSSAGELAAIVTKLGVISSKVLRITTNIDTTNTTTNSTSDLAGAIGTAFNITAVKQSASKLLVIAVTRAQATATSVNGVGLRVGIKRFHDTEGAYNSPATAQSGESTIDTNGTNVNYTYVATVVSMALLQDADRRSNFNWTARLYGNATVAGSTVSNQSTFFICIEFED